MSAAVLSAVRGAIMRAGGHSYILSRTPLDANGQPDGTPIQVGTLYGAVYQQRRVGGLSLDIPGITINNQSAPRMICILTQGTPPKTGDTVTHGTQSAQIVDVTDMRGVCYTLTLDTAIAPWVQP